MIREEQETTVTYSALDDYVHIYTTVPKHIRKLRGRDGVVVRFDRGDELSVTIDADKFDPLSGFKRKGRVISDEERQRLREQLARGRKARNGTKEEQK